MSCVVCGKPLGSEHSNSKCCSLDCRIERRYERLREYEKKRGTLTAGLRFSVFQRDGFRCVYCGAGAQDGATLHVDHIVPRSKGGQSALENLATACSDCNLGKSATLIDADNAAGAA